MNYDKYGQCYSSADELCAMLYEKPDLDLTRFLVESPQQYNNSVKQLYVEFPKLQQYIPSDVNIEEFHTNLQSDWHIPTAYKDLDIAQWVLEKCKTDQELQRVGQELILYQERDLFDLLRFMKYLVDTLRKNNIIWGVGRGSSVASYVLYLLGVHRIDSLYYDLDITEFLK